VILFTLAAVAVNTHVSIMLAGFSYGLAVSGIGEPRRLARQLRHHRGLPRPPVLHLARLVDQSA
jgi:hypothetical protein